MTLHTQVVTMLAMMIGGLYLGFIHESFRRFSVLWRRSSLLTYTFEILFWLSQTVLLFYLLYRMNFGEIRLYLWLALLLGFSIYMVLFQGPYLILLNAIIRLCLRLAKFFYQLIVFPLLYLIKQLIRSLQFMGRSAIRMMAFFYRRIGLPLLKWLLPEKVYYIISKIGALCSTMIHTVYRKLFTFFRK